MHRDTITTTTLVNLTSTHTIITTTKCLQHVQPRIYKVYPEVYKELKWQCIAMFSGVLPTSIVSYMHALALASLKTWNPKESAGRETVLLASCSTGSSSGREVLSTSCSRWPFRVTCLEERVGKKKNALFLPGIVPLKGMCGALIVRPFIHTAVNCEW